MNVADLIGIPFLEGGRTPGEGLDCYGLLRLVQSRRGVELPEDPAELLADQAAVGVEISADLALRQGDVLVLDGGEARPHVGVVLDPFRFVHSIRYRGVSIEKISLWEKRILRRVRLRHEGQE